MEFTEEIIKQKIIEFFPYKKIRKEQEEAILFIINTFLSGKKFSVLEAGTGVGKSAIGYTASKVWGWIASHDSSVDRKNGWFLTTQKVLQEQYERDFKDMKSLYSAKNYECNAKRSTSCGDNMKLFKENKNAPPSCRGPSCVYRMNKIMFESSNESVTNFNFFLTENKFQGKLQPRRLLVIDEAHNAEDVLTSFAEISFSQHFCEKVVGQEWPDKITPAKFVKWLGEVYAHKLYSKIGYFKQKYEEIIGSIEDSQFSNEFKSLSMKLDALISHQSKLIYFLDSYDSENWIIEAEETSENNVKVIFKPIDVSTFAAPLFAMGEKVLLMSATILSKDAFTSSLGIKQEDYEYMSVPSPFPVENRPFNIVDIGSMSMGEIDKSLPKLVRAIEYILDNHPKEKGIIHASTYKISRYIQENISKQHKKRLLSHSSEDRDEVLRKHITSKNSTVLLSPSMTEGVDLKEDLSRFQIICKVPYPYLGDKIVQKRMRRNTKWYGMKTAITILQSVGRSIRSSEDKAESYMMDSDWKKFYSQSSECFTEDFKKTIKR